VLTDKVRKTRDSADCELRGCWFRNPAAFRLQMGCFCSATSHKRNLRRQMSKANLVQIVSSGLLVSFWKANPQKERYRAKKYSNFSTNFESARLFNR